MKKLVNYYKISYFLILLSLFMMSASFAQVPVDRYTQRGSLIPDLYNNPEQYDNPDKAYLDWYIRTYYPNASILGEATTTYNCHGYAWIWGYLGEHLWLGYNYSGAEEIFFEEGYSIGDGSYDLVDETVATHVSYSGDHSARTSGTANYYYSKWGAWPLVYHQKNYVPTGYGTPNQFLIRSVDVPLDYTSIQSALSNAVSGQSVKVTGSFTLYEDINVSSGKVLTFKSGASLNFNGHYIQLSGGTVNIENGATVNCVYVKQSGTAIAMLPTIQSAIDYSSSGQTIELQPRTYNEGFSVSNHSNLTIDGLGSAAINYSSSVNNSSYIYIQNLTMNGLIQVNSSDRTFVEGINFTTGGGLMSDYSSTLTQLRYSSGTASGASFGYTSYNGTGDIYENTISGWDVGVYLGSNASYNVGLFNQFCENGYDIDASTGYAYAISNQYSRQLPGAVYGNVFLTGNANSVCSNNSLNKVKTTLSANEIAGIKDEVYSKYLQVIHQKYSVKDMPGISEAEFKAEILSLISIVKNEIEIASDKYSIKENMSLLMKLYSAVESRKEFYNSASSYLTSKKFSAFYPYIKRYDVQKKIEDKNYAEANLLAAELINSKDADNELTAELQYEKGLINKYYIKDLKAASDAFLAVIKADKEGLLAKYASNEMNGLESSKSITTTINSVAGNEFSLSNYPNPFNPTTKINFTIANPGNVKLSVYNMLGQKIVDLLDGFKDKGSYTINFDASKLSSGVYIYTLQVNGKSISNKMFLIK